MQLKNFVFNPDLYSFTRLLTKELLAFEQTHQCRFVPQNKKGCSQWLPHDDFLERDPTPNNLCYGRYLEYQPNGNCSVLTASTELWIGLEFIKGSGVFFSVWVDSHQASNYDQNYTAKNPVCSEIIPGSPSPDYFIVRWDNAYFENYCKAAKGISGALPNNAIQDFLSEALL